MDSATKSKFAKDIVFLGRNHEELQKALGYAH